MLIFWPSLSKLIRVNWRKWASCVCCHAEVYELIFYSRPENNHLYELIDVNIQQILYVCKHIWVYMHMYAYKLCEHEASTPRTSSTLCSRYNHSTLVYVADRDGRQRVFALRLVSSFSHDAHIPIFLSESMVWPTLLLAPACKRIARYGTWIEFMFMILIPTYVSFMQHALNLYTICDLKCIYASCVCVYRRMCAMHVYVWCMCMASAWISIMHTHVLGLHICVITYTCMHQYMRISL